VPACAVDLQQIAEQRKDLGHLRVARNVGHDPNIAPAGYGDMWPQTLLLSSTAVR
jgi:hypothetical protein